MSADQRESNQQVAPTRGLRLYVAGGLVLGAVVRLPFWVEAWRTPLSTDLSIIGLMAMHPGLDLTMWSQPYGSPTEAWLAVPFFAILGPTAEALRVMYALLALALIPVGTALAHTLHPRAALPAAIILACPPPYFLVLGSLPPPLYPLSLLLCLVSLLMALRLPSEPSLGAYSGIALWGLLSGLALWTHPFCLSFVLPAAFLLGMRHRRRPALLAVGALALLVGIAPVIVGAAEQIGLGSVLSAHGRSVSAARHLSYLVTHLRRPVAGVIGAYAPILADSRTGAVWLPALIAVPLVVVYAGSLLLSVVRRRSIPHAGLLWAVLGLALLCFLLPARSNPNTVRYLTPLYFPVMLLVLLAHGTGVQPRRATLVAVLLAALHLVGGAAVLQAWRGWDRAAAPFVLPELTPVERTLGQLGIRRGFSSRDVAFRITFATQERIILAQPWNQRFHGSRVPYLDEVRFARRLAWVVPHHDTNPFPLPSPAEVGQRLRVTGGRWKTVDAGPAAVFHGFEPPFSEQVDAVDTNLLTRNGSTLTMDLSSAGPLAALTVLAPFDKGYLPDDLALRAWIDDGAGHLREIRHRVRGGALQWVGGHPEPAIYGDVRAFVLPGGVVHRATLSSPSGRPWTPGVILVHPVSREQATAIPEWLDPDAGWGARLISLQAQPRPHVAGWRFRVMLAERRRRGLTGCDFPPARSRTPR